MADFQVDLKEAAQVAADLQSVLAILEKCGMMGTGDQDSLCYIEDFLSVDSRTDSKYVTSMAARLTFCKSG